MRSSLLLAYLDAGSTSMLLAALAGGAAGLRMFIKSKWDKVRRGNAATDVDEHTEPDASPVEQDVSGTS